MWWRRGIAIGLLAGYVAGQGYTAWSAVSKAKHGRDYATYHYAVQVAVDGGDPYNNRQLAQAARKEGIRRSVHPYLYPPPFLFSMLWSVPLSLPSAYQAWFFINQAFLLGLLWVFHRWMRTHWMGLALIAVTFSPIADSVKMGQVNLMVLLLAAIALWRTNGLWLSAAAMAKMSPAILLAWWIVRLEVRAVLLAGVGAVGLSLLALSLVGVEVQENFYTNVLPGFSQGDYNGLKVPVTLPANHSIPDIYNQIWPGPTKHTLSETGQRWSSLTSLGLLAVLCAFARRRRDYVGDAGLAGAFVVLMVITPAYTYEHHLAFLVLPVVALATAIQHRRLPTWSWPLAAAAYFFVAWPLWWLRWVQDQLPPLRWLLQESKFFGVVVIGILCVWAAARSPIIEEERVAVTR